jgi:hypothetical protein
MSLDLDYSLLSTQKRVFEYTATQNQVTFSGVDGSGNTLAIDTGSTVKVYVNDVLQTSGITTNATNNEVTFSTTPAPDTASYVITVIVSDAATDSDFLTTVTTEATDAETYIEENDPNYDPLDTNTYYSEIKIESYLDDLNYATEDFAVSTSLSALNFAIGHAEDLFLEEKNRALDAESALDTRLTTAESDITTKLNTSDFASTFDSRIAVTSVDSLSDVDTTTNAPATGESLVWDGTNFVPGIAFSGSDFDTAFSNKSTDDLSEGSTNLYYTDSRVETKIDSYVTGGTGVTVTSGEIAIGQSVGTTDNVTFNDVTVNGTLSSDDITAATMTASGNVVVQGNLTVNGTTTTVNSNQVDIGDSMILLNSDETGTPSQNGGFIVERGTEENVRFVWDESNDRFTAQVYNSTTTNWDVVPIAASNFVGDVTGNITGNVTGTVSDISNHTTDDLTEGTSNLYYTEARVDARIALQTGSNIDLSQKTTDDLAEGSTNLYFTDARAQSAITVTDAGGLGSLTYVNGTITYTGPADSDIRGLISATTSTGVTFDSSTGVIALASIPNSSLTNSTISVNGTSISLGGSGSFTTNAVSEGSNNLYYTNARVTTLLGSTSINALSDVDTASNGPSGGDALVWDSNNAKWVPSAPFSQSDFDTAFGAKTTDDLTEGSTNLYYTTTRQNTDFDSRLALKSTNDLAEGTGVNANLYYTEARVNANFNAKSTDNLTEGTNNLYYTDARVNTFLASGSAGNIVTSGYLAGPATFTIDPAGVGDNTGTVVIAGNLTVEGTTTTINSTTLSVDDLNIVLGDGATNAAAANGGGVTLDLGSDGLATFTYDSGNDRWTMNKNLATNLVGNVTGNVTGQVSDISNHDTDALSEGSNNLYYTDGRVGAYLTAQGITSQPVWSEVTSTTVTATIGSRMIIDTSTNSVTVTMPSSPSFGDEVRIIDGTGNAATNRITVTSGDNINGSSSDLIIDANGAGFGLVYYNSSRGWILIDK